MASCNVHGHLLISATSRGISWQEEIYTQALDVILTKLGGEGG